MYYKLSQAILDEVLRKEPELRSSEGSDLRLSLGSQGIRYVLLHRSVTFVSHFLYLCLSVSHALTTVLNDRD